MESGWKKVYSGTDTFKARLLKEKLESLDIRCVLMDKKDSAYVMIGEIELYVQEANFLKAINIIQQGAME
ncbi:MAG: DUF2007 domain-containing protein [Chitinophagales bacterium]